LPYFDVRWALTQILTHIGLHSVMLNCGTVLDDDMITSLAVLRLYYFFVLGLLTLSRLLDAQNNQSSP